MEFQSAVRDKARSKDIGMFYQKIVRSSHQLPFTSIPAVVSRLNQPLFNLKYYVVIVYEESAVYSIKNV
jgi:hypothetical protein